MSSEQIDVSMKYLLKQVYSTHIAKIKGLDEEIQTLKNQLLEADRKIKQQEKDCKRCAELEEAFKSCKAALHEQSKWFENLGEKFSVFNSSANKSLSKNASLSLDGTEVHADISVNQQLCKAATEKSINRPNLLRNLMNFNSNENQDSLDLCSVPLQDFAHDFSTLNSDSLILAPDTVDIINDANPKYSEINKNVVLEFLPKPKAKIASVKDSKEFSDKAIIIPGNVTECKETNRQAKKRSLTESSGSEKNTKKLSKDSATDVNIMKSITKHKLVGKCLDPQSLEDQDIETQNPGKNVTCSSSIKSVDKEKIDKNVNPQNSEGTFVSSGKKSDNAIDTTCSSKKKKIQTSPLDIEICKDVTVHLASNLNNQAEKQNNSLNKGGTNVILNGSQYQVSPSLLPLNNSSKPVLIEQGFVIEDINDFQSPILNKKQVTDDGTWTACNKKKLKKQQPTKMVKSSSKFKMHLDSLPPNYKKPTYRQTKLSKSIFQPKASTSSSGTNDIPQVLGDYNISSSSSEESDHISLPIQSTVKTKVIDFDATCIPDNYEIIPSKSVNREKISDENSDSIMYLNADGIDESSNDSVSSSPVCKRILKQSTDKSDSAVFEDFISNHKGTVQDYSNSFDRLPKKEEPNYKYKEETVRKKAERKQLNGFDCKECENYYSELGLSDKEKQERLKKCSRHRAKFAPPATPEHFWELEFPDTQECKARGYLNETQKVKLKSHRRRPLDI